MHWGCPWLEGADGCPWGGVAALSFKVIIISGVILGLLALIVTSLIILIILWRKVRAGSPPLAEPGAGVGPSHWARELAQGAGLPTLCSLAGMPSSWASRGRRNRADGVVGGVPSHGAPRGCRSLPESNVSQLSSSLVPPTPLQTALPAPLTLNSVPAFAPL